MNLTFITGPQNFPSVSCRSSNYRLPSDQGQLSRIWKVQCDWLSMGKDCCLWLSRRLWGGMKNELPKKKPAWEENLCCSSKPNIT